MSETRGRITANCDLIYRSYDPREFVGRRWLVDAVAALKDSSTPDQLIIIGEPGSGKTAFSAYLAETWNSPRHFIRVDSVGSTTGTDPRLFLLSVGAQLHEAYGPTLFERPGAGSTRVKVGLATGQAQIVGRLIDELHTLPFLVRERDVEVSAKIATGTSQIIGERVKRLVDVTLALPETALLEVAVLAPLRRLHAQDPDERVVLIIDGLDEASPVVAHGILDVIPRPNDTGFPANLRLVMTSRPGEHLTRFATHQLLRLDDLESGNLENNRCDAKAYIERRLRTSALTTATATWRPSELDAWISQVEELSDGNFLYLYHLFAQMTELARGGEIQPRDVVVPRGLDDIYRFFAVEKIKADTSMRDWVEIYKPLLALLSVVRDPVPRAWLAEFLAIDVAYVEYVIGAIRQFLDEAPTPDGPGFRLYHVSFGEYLQDQTRNRDYPIDGPAAHSSVVAHYRGHAGWAGDDWVTRIDRYALVHLIEHMIAARSEAELPELLGHGDRSNRWAEAHFAEFQHYSTYIRDLDRALDVAISRGDFAEVLRMAVFQSSLTSATRNLPLPLVKRCLQEGLITSNHALDLLVTERGPDIESIARVYALLDADGQARARRIIRRASPEQVAVGLVEAHESLDVPLHECAVEALMHASLKLDPMFVDSVVGLASRLPRQLRPTLTATTSSWSPLERARVLDAIGQHDEAQVSVKAWLTPLVETMERSSTWFGVLGLELETAISLAGVDDATRVSRLFERLTPSRDSSSAWPPFAALTRRLVALGRIDEALAVVRVAWPPQERFTVVCEVMTALPQRLFAEGVELARGLPEPDMRALALTKTLDPGEPEDERLREILAAIEEIPELSLRSRVQVYLAGHVNADLRDELLDRAIRSVRQILPNIRPAAWLAPLLPESLREALVLEAAEALHAALADADDLLDAMLTNPTPIEQIRSLEGLLSPDAAAIIFDIARRLPSDHERREVVARVLPRLDSSLRAEAWQVLMDELPRSATIYDQRWWDVFAQHASVEQLLRVLPRLRVVGDEPLRLELIRAFARQLEPHMLPELVERAAEIDEDDLRAAVFEALEERRAETWHRQDAGASPAWIADEPEAALCRATQLGHPRSVAMELDLVLPALAPERRATVLDDALAMAEQLEPGARAICVARLARHALEPRRTQHADQAIARARAIEDPLERFLCLLRISPSLPEAERVPLLEELAHRAPRLAQRRQVGQALRAIVPMLDVSGIATMLESARRRKGKASMAWRVEATLRTLSGRLPDELAHAALDCARAVHDVGTRGVALTHVATSLHEPLRAEVIEEAMKLGAAPPEDTVARELARVKAANPDELYSSVKFYELLALLAHGEQAVAVVESYLRAKLRTMATWERRDLAAGAPHLAELMARLWGAEIMPTAIRAVLDVSRWWP